MQLPGKMIPLVGYDLSPVEQELNDREDNTVIFFLPDNLYGYGYAYTEEGHRSNCAKDRFTEEEMLGDIDELIGAKNLTAYIGEHASRLEALEEVVCFWSGMERGYYNASLTLKEAMEVGRWLGVDYLIIKYRQEIWKNES